VGDFFPVCSFGFGLKMDKERVARLMEEEGEGITVEEDVITEGEAFGRTLVGKIWTDVPYNVRAFK
jgi:hypothetical protein